MKLNSKGRCCGRKPIVYKAYDPHKYCPRCDRAFDSTSGQQIANWAWRDNGSGEFVAAHPQQEKP